MQPDRVAAKSQLNFVDWEQLEMIADGFSPEFMDIFREFVAEVPQLLATIREEAAAGDVHGVVRTAHQLKGSSLNFGFAGLTQAVVTIEAEAKDGTIAHVQSLADTAEAAFHAALEVIKARRNPHQA